MINMLLIGDNSRVIEMEWEDRTSFESVKFQFNLNEKEVIEFMRLSLKPTSFI